MKSLISRLSASEGLFGYVRRALGLKEIVGADDAGTKFIRYTDKNDYGETVERRECIPRDPNNWDINQVICRCDRFIRYKCCQWKWRKPTKYTQATRCVDYSLAGHCGTQVDPAWRQWMSGTRRFPPTPEEIEQNRNRIAMVRARAAIIQKEDERRRLRCDGRCHGFHTQGTICPVLLQRVPLRGSAETRTLQVKKGHPWTTSSGSCVRPGRRHRGTCTQSRPSLGVGRVTPSKPSRGSPASRRTSGGPSRRGCCLASPQPIGVAKEGVYVRFLAVQRERIRLGNCMGIIL